MLFFGRVFQHIVQPNMLDIFVGLLETKTFLIAIITLPILAGTTLPLLYNRLELSQAFHTPERIKKDEFDYKKQQRFIKKYNSRIDNRHLELIDNKYIKKRVSKNTSC